MNLCRTDSPAYHEPESDLSPEWAVAAAEERVEDEAESMAYCGHLEFVEYVGDLDHDTIATIIIAAMKRRWGGPIGDGANTTLDERLDQIMLDWKQWRVSQADLETLAAEIEADTKADMKALAAGE